MKISIYDLLGMIKDGKAPNIIKYQENILAYDRQSQDYYCEEYGNLFEYLINERRTSEFLNELVEIIETTITYKQDNIEKLKTHKEIDEPDYYANYLEVYDGGECEIDEATSFIVDKINEIIDKLNGE